MTRRVFTAPVAVLCIVAHAAACQTDGGLDIAITDAQVFETARADDSYEFAFRYTLENVGGVPIDLDGPDSGIYADNIGVQTYLVDAPDLSGAVFAAGGSAILNPLVLQPGDVYEGIYRANTRQLPDPTDPAGFAWIVVDVIMPNLLDPLPNNRIVIGIDARCGVADLAAPFGSLGFEDIETFVNAFLGDSPAADIAAPAGELDFRDIEAFVTNFLAGCP